MGELCELVGKWESLPILHIYAVETRHRGFGQVFSAQTLKVLQNALMYEVRIAASFNATSVDWSNGIAKDVPKYI